MSEITDKIDRFGHCIVCGDNLLTKRVVDGKIVDMFLPTYDDTMFLLDNGSQMQVTICKKCKSNVDFNNPDTHKNIMECAMKGWELETKTLVSDQTLPEWTDDFRNNYLEEMSKLSIHCHSANLDKYTIQTKQMELLKAKVEDVIN